MDFKKYINIVSWFLENDNREENYHNRVLIPLLETLCIDTDVEDTSMLTIINFLCSARMQNFEKDIIF